MFSGDESAEEIAEIKKKIVMGDVETDDEEDEDKKKKRSGAGIGLSNVIQRLKIHFDRDVLSIESEEGKYTRFILMVSGGEKNL